MKFQDIKVGDKLIRLLGGSLPMLMVVADISNDHITCNALEKSGHIFPGGWTFCPLTGAEIDDDLRWGPKYGATGSILLDADQSLEWFSKVV